MLYRRLTQMMDQNNQIVEKKESLFTKIKKFIRKILNKDNSNDSEEKVKNDSKVNIERANNFVDEVKIENNQEMERLLKLQEEFREGKITQGDLSDEDIDKLGKLYDEQIEKIKVQIEECKKRIEDKKKKLQKT